MLLSAYYVPACPRSLGTAVEQASSLSAWISLWCSEYWTKLSHMSYRACTAAGVACTMVSRSQGLGLFLAKKGADRGLPAEEPKLMENSKHCLQSACYMPIEGFSL